MRVFTETVTFDGGGAKQLALLTTQVRACRLYVEPDADNGSVAYVGDADLDIGDSTVDHVIKQIAAPVDATSVLDHFDLSVNDGNNRIELAQYAFDGADGEIVRVTVYVG